MRFVELFRHEGSERRSCGASAAVIIVDEIESRDRGAIRLFAGLSVSIPYVSIAALLRKLTCGL